MLGLLSFTYDEVEAAEKEINSKSLRKYIDVDLTTSNVSTLFLCHLQTNDGTGSAYKN
jgi:hypothetical protein